MEQVQIKEQDIWFFRLPEMYQEIMIGIDAEKTTVAYPKDGNTSGIFSEVGFGLVDIADKAIDIKVYGIGNTSNFKDVHVMDEVKIQ